MNMTIDLVKKDFERTLNFLKINSTIFTIPFLDYKKGNKKLPGNYVIFDPVLGIVIYTGVGQIFVRQLHHENKALNKIIGSTRDTSGYKWLRNNLDYDISNWILIYAEVDSRLDQKAIEGCLIKFLEPLANDETFKEREKV